MAKAILYWLLNSPAEWPPRLDLGVILLVFRVGNFPLALLFSVAGFVRMLLIAYTWLIVLLTLGRGAAEPDPIQRIIALQFGRLARWPAWVLLLLPLMGVLLFWVAGHPLLLLAEAVAPATSWGALLGQGLIVCLAMFLTLKYLIPVILLLHLLSSYVYMGSHPIWDFVSAVSRTVLKPLQRLPLRSSRMDFAPLAGILLVLLLLHALPTWLISMAQDRNLPLWP